MTEKEKAIVMDEPQNHRHTVIGAQWNEVFHERFGIAYRDEESPRELKAVADLPDRLSTDADLNNTREKPPFRCEDDPCGPQSLRQHMRRRVGLAETRHLTYATLRNAFVAGALLFYSRSILGAVMRAFMGAT